MTTALTEPEALLRTRFGLPHFRPGQREVIDALLTRGAALAVFPTGGGKSLCYQLPALLFEGVTLVVSPLIALMKDQIDYLSGLGIPAARLDSSLSSDQSRDIGADLRAGRLRLLYVAPERFNNERFLMELQRAPISLMAIDEAHCISEWGHNFRPDYLKLAQYAKDLNAERVLALTATATPAVVADICTSFDIPPACAVVTGFHRPNLQLLTSPVATATRQEALLQRLQRRPPGATIVYVTLQKTAEHLAGFLATSGLPARPYHAGMDDASRSAVQNWWTTSDTAIVVATIAFGMGIDKADVRYVYHYNLPKSLESYSQEIGRAGRDGRPSIVELLASGDDVPILENFAYGDTPTPASLQTLVHEVLTAGPEFDVSSADLSTRFDIRPLVVRTLLTYLELLGVLRQRTPFYSAYEVKLLTSLDVILQRFDADRRQFLESLFTAARKGRIWYHLDPAAAATELGTERDRILRALHYLEEQQLIELRATDVRLRFERVDTQPVQSEALSESIVQRFERREQHEIARLQQVLELITASGCQTAALVGYFGEVLPEVCGHCTFCQTQHAQVLPAPARMTPSDVSLDAAAFCQLVELHQVDLGSPRQQARFLCGLSSPATSRARLGSHPLFGALAEHRFAEVLAWCTRRPASATKLSIT